MLIGLNGNVCIRFFCFGRRNRVLSLTDTDQASGSPIPTSFIVSSCPNLIVVCAPAFTRTLNRGSKRESQKIPSFRMMKIQSTPRLT